MKLAIVKRYLVTADENGRGYLGSRVIAKLDDECPLEVAEALCAEHNGPSAPPAVDGGMRPVVDPPGLGGVLDDDEPFDGVPADVG